MSKPLLSLITLNDVLVQMGVDSREHKALVPLQRQGVSQPMLIFRVVALGALGSICVKANSNP